MATPLDDARYINLMSFKRDGAGVETPVWAAPLDGKLVVFTNRDSYKVKRIGRNPKVRVARCDARGKVLGPWLDGTCAIAGDPVQNGRILEALGRKYGLQMRVLNFFAGLVGRDKQRAYLEISLLVLLVCAMPACAFLAKSPALKSPLHEQLRKAEGTRIEQVAKDCLAQEGWKPDDIGSFAEGATVVSAKNAAKERVSVYIQPPEMDPRVTGGPGYDDPFWVCLGHDLANPKAPPAEAPSGDAP